MIASTHQEEFSCAFIRAIVANAGCSIGKPVPDRGGIDFTISSEDYCFPKIDVQVKSTKRYTAEDNFIAYDLDKKSYNLLRADSHTQRILVIVTLPDHHSKWSNATEENLLLRHCAYWTNLRKSSPHNAKGKVRIRVPRTNIFTASALSDMMKAISERLYL